MQRTPHGVGKESPQLYVTEYGRTNVFEFWAQAVTDWVVGHSNGNYSVNCTTNSRYNVSTKTPAFGRAHGRVRFVICFSLGFYFVAISSYPELFTGVDEGCMRALPHPDTSEVVWHNPSSELD